MSLRLKYIWMSKFALLLYVFADVRAISLQAERIMEALELYKEETRKMEEHRYACANAGKEVEARSSSDTFRHLWNLAWSLKKLVCEFLWCQHSDLSDKCDKRLMLFCSCLHQNPILSWWLMETFRWVEQWWRLTPLRHWALISPVNLHIVISCR